MVSVRGCIHSMYNIIKQVWMVGGIYIIWVCLHFAASHLYTHFCTPLTWAGFVLSPFLVASPHCHALRWCIDNGGNAISTMWVVFGTWLATRFLYVRGNDNYH